jgi:hypothetical protein
MVKLSTRIALLFTLLLVLSPASTQAVPWLPSSFSGFPLPPSIQVVAPVDGTYMLIEHGEDGARLVTHAVLREGDVARFPMPILDGVTEYHVQVMRNVFADHVMYVTLRHRGYMVRLPMALKPALPPVYLPMMGS